LVGSAAPVPGSRTLHVSRLRRPMPGLGRSGGPGELAPDATGAGEWQGMFVLDTRLDKAAADGRKAHGE